MFHLRSFTLKLADFGMSRPSDPPLRAITPRRCTALYRSPEALLWSEQYGAPSDLWAAGCIFAELLSGHVLFLRPTEIQIVKQIFSTLGSPNEVNWPGFYALPLADTYRKMIPQNEPGAFACSSNI